MARSRNIKPGFFNNEILGELPALTRLLFIGLWCLADREGRLQDRPKRIKKELLGYDDLTADDVDQMLQQLHDNNFITRYTVGAEHYIQVNNFLKHQNPHCKEQASVIPALGCAFNNSDEGLDVAADRIKGRTASTGIDDGNADREFPVTAVENAEKSKSTVHAQCRHDANTVVAGLIPDSLNLIPDTFKILSCADEQAHGERGPVDSDETLTVGDDAVKGREARGELFVTPEKTGEGMEGALGAKGKAQERSPDWKTAKTPLEVGFCKFWDEYPDVRHVGKLSCWRKWQKLKPDDALLQQILTTLQQWKNCWEWQKEGGQYVPHPLTWLNRGGWEDECAGDKKAYCNGKQPSKGNRFNNFRQREYDYESLEAQLLGKGEADNE
ncbi:MAG: hypothetical protein Q4C59_10340 [Lachnospiraceae bacterium]|nr:hypothetical protein [Lachnospiraceae bacterium]